MARCIADGMGICIGYMTDATQYYCHDDQGPVSHTTATARAPKDGDIAQGKRQLRDGTGLFAISGAAKMAGPDGK